MTPLDAIDDETAPHPKRTIGTVLIASGLAGAAWWIWTWTRVRTLINDYVAEFGPLPSGPEARAALGRNGTEAQRQLSNDLDAIAGLYPWGRLPLVLAVLAVAAGWLSFGPSSQRRTIVAAAVALVAFGIPMVFLGDTMQIALAILE